MGLFRTLVTLPYVKPGDPADMILREAGGETVFAPWHSGRTEEELIDLLRDKDASLAFLDPYTERVMTACPGLKVISRSGVGYDNVDVPAATRLGIAVTTTPGRNHNAVAEYTMALMLQCYRKLYENLLEGRKERWVMKQGRDLAGRTLGIVGLGAIGKEVAKRARAFEMKVLAYDLFEDSDFAGRYSVRYASLEELLRESDFVSLHLFLSEQTSHIINAERLALMKPTAYIINTSRGGVLDTEAIFNALKEKRIAGAALDVFESEPLAADDPLRTLENLYISPHCAGVTDDARYAMSEMGAENIVRLLKGEKPLHIVNADVLGVLRK